MNIKRIIFLTIGILSFSIGVARAEGGEHFPNEHFKADITNQPSLQRGAALFANYCSGCHSVKYQRYNRTFKDLGIPEDLGKDNLIFTGAKVVDQMHRAMDGHEAQKWFGKEPPDLSLLARAKGSQYIYNYLNAFYVDNGRPLGFNNSVFPGASMPNPLWQLQGLRVPVYSHEEHCSTGEDGKKVCDKEDKLTGFKNITKGTMSELEYKQVTRDLTNYLTYLSDPSALDRMRLGPWVLAFLFLMTIVFYFLKKEYWRDVH